MAPKRKRGEASPAVNRPTGLEPALGRSTVLNLKGVDKVRQVIAVDSNECKATKIWPASRFATDLEVTNISLHLLAIFTSLLPPFSDFFNVVLTHYQVHALHLDPESIVLLSAFAFLYEAFMGITPSMALLRHFFSLQMIIGGRCSGCVSLRVVDATAGAGVDVELRPKAEGFQRQWMYVAAAVYSPLLQASMAPVKPRSGWEHARLVFPRLARVMTRQADLRKAGVLMAIVVREFARW